MDDLSILRVPYNKKSIFYNMKSKTSKSKPREVTLSAAELSRFGMGVMSKALKVVNTAKKGKITIRVERV
ncbi:hypothetical protein C6990_04000 [Nitrosopumilus sp. b3]|nr:hypothetical protein C6990_04000 [Nitrosopumilus sp. b3]